MKSLYRIIMILTFALNGFSQNSSPAETHDKMLWVGYYNSIILDPKWSVNSDIQFRTKNWIHDFSQALIRSDISYKISDNVSASIGVAHFRFFLDNETTRGEWRPWQEIKLSNKLGNLNLIQRVRLEQRFIEGITDNQPSGDYNFNVRFRYRFDLKFPLTKEKEEGKKIYLLLGNEVMINAADGKTNFDQNRLFLALNYELNKKISLQAQYIHIWQNLSSSNTLLNLEVIRFNLYHTISI
jgi:hypothetical protein